MKKGKLISHFKEWESYTYKTKDLTNVVVQDVDFTYKEVSWDQFKFNNTSFLSCKFKKGQAIELISLGAFVYPKFGELPYNPYRTQLYKHQELLEGYEAGNDNSVDLKIYKRFKENRYTPPLHEAMAQRLHDFNIDEALRRLLDYSREGMTSKKCVGFMGGHSTTRDSEAYKNAALTAKLLAEDGYYVVTGGGPGIMEAANYGAYMAGKSHEDFYEGLAILTDLSFDIPIDNPRDYLASNYVTNAQSVLAKFPEGHENLAIPTWFYGHEPTNVFATDIAKYFSNSLREDILLAICLYGVVFAPGSAGTTQEIFQEAAQNHYGTFGFYSPMVFLGKKRYVEDTSLYSVLHQLAIGQPYKELLHLTDKPEDVLKFIQDNPPRPIL
ncbi:MAG: LOG family protein [Weeksellaceae bacterium]